MKVIKKNSFIGLIMLLLISVCFFCSAANAENGFLTKFKFTPPTSAQSVSVAGTFNDWNKDVNPMKEGNGGIWETEIYVKPGVHQYKFVINGNLWLADPLAKETADDGQGGRNSVLRSGADLFNFLKGVNPFDDTIEISGLEHNAAEVKYVQAVKDINVRIVLRSFKNDIKSAGLLISGAGMDRERKIFKIIPMIKFAKDEVYDYYKAYIRTDCDYIFTVSSGNKTLFYGKNKSFDLRDKTVKSSPEFKNNSFIIDNSFPAPMRFASVVTDYWWPEAVFYQIFPDRFYDGDKSLNQRYVMPWGTKPVYDNFMGGDLAGIAEKIGHIKELGADAIYLNPIFMSKSNHKYDTIDYFTVDKTLGGNTALKKLVDAAHSENMKIILDGVFNHTSTDYFAFNHVKMFGEKSRYAGWYNFKSFPVNMQKPNYECWYNIGSMPKLNIKNDEVCNHILSVPEYWLKNFNIDGFRLDVPNELPHDFWKAFRKKVRSVSDYAYIVGEIWTDPKEWLNGDEFDAVMNYKLRDALISFFVKKEISPAKFGAIIDENKVNLPELSFMSQLNLLDSHDTPRFLTVCNNDAAIFKTAAAFIMTYPGAPCIYYGDETGMTGGKDPDNRRCMEWDESKWNRDIFEFYKKMIAFRKSNVEMTKGDIFTMYDDEDGEIYAFIRTYKGSTTLCVFNRDSGNERNFNLAVGKILDYTGIRNTIVNNIQFNDILGSGSFAVNVKSQKAVNIKVGPKNFIIYKLNFIN